MISIVANRRFPERGSVNVVARGGQSRPSHMFLVQE
jgi:hypothetical protein